MYLKEIVLSGFKSFADRTRLDLQRGVTAVVGPNGCGKSNIVDALRWVLGEQSAKALRGGSMQDVIFEGTEKRRGLGLCEVALTFGDCEKSLGTAFNEVEVSRKVTRDGGSDYYINGKVSRLKDIQRLFANTGVGRVSYSFMVQGQIDQILSTNPAERRTIFEEAAGITLYKSQRKEAMGKLSLVETNLNRVTDVIDEISRQIGSLKRQASKALRYQRIKHRLTHLDLAFSAHRHQNLQKSIQVLANQAAEVRRDLNKVEAALATGENELGLLKAARAEAFEAMQIAQQRVYELRSGKEKAEAEAKMAEVRKQDLQGRIDAFGKEIESLEEQRENLSVRARSEAESKQMQLGIVDDSDRIFKERTADLVRSQELLSKLENDFQQRRQTLLEAENRITRARSRATTLEVDLRSFQVKYSGLRDSLSELEAGMPSLEKRREELALLLEKKRGAQAKLEGDLAAGRENAKELGSTLKALQQTIQEADRELAKKSAQVGILENLQAKFEGFGEGAKAILGGKLNGFAAEDSLAVLSRGIKVQKAYSKALETLLGTALEAIHVGPSKHALSIIDELKERTLGRACLQITLGSAKEASAAIDLPDGLIAALSVVSARNAHLSAPLEKLLDSCYFADSAKDFIAFWKANPGFTFTFVATADGVLIDARGLIYGGESSGKPSSSMLDREAEIERLREEINAEKEGLKRLHDEAGEIDSQRDEAEVQVERIRKTLGELNSEVSGLVAEERSERQRLESLEKQKQGYETQMERLESSRAEATESLDKAKAELLSAEEGLKSEKDRGTTLEDEIVKAREARDARRESVADVRLELAEKKQRLQSLDRALGEVERESASLNQRITSRRQEIDALNEQIGGLEETGLSQKGRAAEVEKTLEVTLEQLAQQRAHLEKADKQLEALDGALSGDRAKEREFDQILNKKEVRLAEERSQRSFLEENVRSEYGLELEEISWKAQLWKAEVEFAKRVNLDELDDPDKLQTQPKDERGEPTAADLQAMDETDWESVEAEVRDLKGRLASMGPVNLDAIAEYADLKERYDFLRGQSEDLWNSKNALVEAIDEINATSQNLFKDTFDQIRKNFQYTYEKLSGGGDADLKLVDSEDPLESGIEIIARPPGTRLHNITLLSGGQRTMAAVAMLFAIYLVKPSPFCVLDEIDAALDDANIGRFCEVLHGFTARSQFLIITHNKRTISNADTVFGVTMPEKGVSRLLSMRFNEDKNRAEPVAPVAGV